MEQKSQHLYQQNIGAYSLHLCSMSAFITHDIAMWDPKINFVLFRVQKVHKGLKELRDLQVNLCQSKFYCVQSGSTVWVINQWCDVLFPFSRLLIISSLVSKGLYEVQSWEKAFFLADLFFLCFCFLSCLKSSNKHNLDKYKKQFYEDDFIYEAEKSKPEQPGLIWKPVALTPSCGSPDTNKYIQAFTVTSNNWFTSLGRFWSTLLSELS